MRWNSLLFATLTTSLLATAAHAQNYQVCLRLPVQIADETGMANEIGRSGDWKARGIRVENVFYNGIPVPGFPKHANADSGCFTFTAPGVPTHPANVVVGIKSWGMLGGNNELRVHNDSGVTSYYMNGFVLPGYGGTHVVAWQSYSKLLSMYAIYAYAINDGFRGRYDDELLRVWYHADSTTDGASPCGCDDLDADETSWGACTCKAGDVGHVTVPDSQIQRKYVLTHEYGHRVISDSIGVGTTNNCSFDSDGDPSTDNGGHGMRGAEWNSCAAMEGWGHFVAADVWTSGQHSGGDPVGHINYWGSGSPIIDVESGQGGCSNLAAGDSTNFRGAYADNCMSVNAEYQVACDGGDCDGIGAELDWMRMWWDFHTDSDHPGGIQDHEDIQTAIEASGGWTKDTAFDDMLNGMYAIGNSIGIRFQEVSNYNGVSEP